MDAVASLLAQISNSDLLVARKTLPLDCRELKLGFTISNQILAHPDRWLANSGRKCTIAASISVKTPSMSPSLRLQWAERLVEGGATEQWGENWVEDYKGSGEGTKKVGSPTKTYEIRVQMLG